MPEIYKRKAMDGKGGSDSASNEGMSHDVTSDLTSDWATGRNGESSGSPLANKRSVSYVNLTPWVMKLIFLHTYYAYIYIFYMFVLAFYKGYALVYPDWRRSIEMVLIMLVPFLQHLRFYFGHWGCELGMPHDLCFFMLLCSVVMVVLMYFLFFQAYIMPLDSTFLFVAIAIVSVEGICGAINALQVMKLRTATSMQIVGLTFSVVVLFCTVTLFISRQLMPQEGVVQEMRLETGV
eukprot:TRINITY_DN9649_c0_g1_i2.p1 TRINITY_DN9649_c0_g1~~TRINITY_DN9649_c0_g1_i2.p1  ORF type:complete len:236 (+),score=40.75 TRINITY_DN9649_c0_g1_i2:85-792(+)